jgi:hypothetical protein
MKRYLGAREQLLGFRKVAVPSPVAPAPRHPISTVPASERQLHLSMIPGRKAEQPPAPAASLQLCVVQAPNGAVYPLILGENRRRRPWLALPARLLVSLRAQLQRLGALVKSRRWLRPLLSATPPLGEKTL